MKNYIEKYLRLVVMFGCAIIVGLELRENSWLGYILAILWTFNFFMWSSNYGWQIRRDTLKELLDDLREKQS